MLHILIRKSRSFIFYRKPFGELLTKLSDLSHHLKYSFEGDKLHDDKDHLKYYLTKHYHMIEKGLALPEPRLGFGQPNIAKVVSKAIRYETLFGADQLTESIRKTLVEYLDFNRQKAFKLPDEFYRAVNDFIQQGQTGTQGGLKHITKRCVDSLTLQDFKEFTESRVSVRNFSEESVPVDVLYSVVDIAKSAPSVCNRQGWKVHCYNDRHQIKELLAYQNGNRGFTDVIDKLLIVTADTKAFTAFESNQVYIDGGLFSMNLLLSIHAAGLGACCLNTCFPYVREIEVKKVASIPSSERIIMMIAVGSLKENFSVAFSPRNPTNEIFVVH